MKQKNKKPIISVNIPTFNSEKTLEKILKAVKAQTYKDYEIIIIDHYSEDKTLEIAKKYTKKIYMDKGKLLSSRHIGVKKSKGKFILFLDSDQILDSNAFEKIAKSFEKNDYDMLILEERSYKTKNILEKITDLDRKIVQEQYEINPTKSVLLARVFKKDLLLKVFKKIDPELYKIVTVEDHAIIYYESWKITKKIGLIKKAVFHMEPSKWSEIYHHYHAWGKRSKSSKTMLPKEYRDMFESKMRYRLKNLNWFDPRTYIILVPIILKGLAYKIGHNYSKD